MKAKYLMFLLCALLPLSMWAAPKKDPVEIKSVKFSKVQRAKILRSGGDWTRVEVALQAVGSGSDWFRNVEIGLTLVYQNVKGASVGAVVDAKGNVQKDASSEKFVVFKSSAKLFALKGGSTRSVVFYIPWEAYDIYRISGDPYAWHVSMVVDGNEVKLSRRNYKSMLSKIILKSSDPAKAFASFKALVDKSSQGNDGVLMALPDCPFNVKRYEYEVSSDGGNQPVPSYVRTK